MSLFQKLIANAVTFCTTYIVLMIPTYLLPYFGSNSAVITGTALAAEAGVNPGFLIHAACLAGLILMTAVRGGYVGRLWIIIFPILATLFDLMPGLNFVPFVPTLMHLLCLIFGVAVKPIAVEVREHT